MKVSSSANGYVVTHTKQGHTLQCTLYGSVTPERIAAAKTELAHRADQLFTVAPPPASETYRTRTASYRDSDWDYDDDEFDDE